MAALAHLKTLHGFRMDTFSNINENHKPQQQVIRLRLELDISKIKTVLTVSLVITGLNFNQDEWLVY
jgi:hypothetical protein